MKFAIWYAVIGALLLFLVFVTHWVKRMPLSVAIIYLGLGWTFGRVGWIQLDSLQHAVWLERLSEIAVIISLFNVGLKLRVPLRSPLWKTPLLLAFGSMAITVGLISLLGVTWLQLPLGAAIILGAVLAPTDPVLASDVQVEKPGDVDRLRFTLTGEAGMNDGTAFPFVMLGLGLLGLHELGRAGGRWWALDVLWACIGGIALGGFLGFVVTRLVLRLRLKHKQGTGLDDFLALGLIGLTYGLSLLIHVYGFLAVFAAGLVLRNLERIHSRSKEVKPLEPAVHAQSDLPTDPHHGPAYMAAAVLHFNEQLERIAELTLVLVSGALLAVTPFSISGLGIAAALFFIIRPLATMVCFWLGDLSLSQTALVGWFGVRGIGSLYYLFYAVNHGCPLPLAQELTSITLCVVSISIVAHGITVTPMMRWYRRYGAK